MATHHTNMAWKHVARPPPHAYRIPSLALIATIVCFSPDATIAAFTSQPSAVNVAPTSLTIRSTINVNDNIRCVVLLDGATAPTAAEVNAGTGSGGAAAVQAPSSVAATAGSAADIAVTGLTSATAYDAYCATSTGGVLSSKLDFVTVGFTSQPSAVNVAPTSLTIRSTISISDDVRCVVLSDGATAPTAAEVNAGTGSGGAAAVQAPSSVSATAGIAADIAITGLTGGTAYDAYCATSTDNVLSSRLDFVTIGFTTQPADVNVGPTTLSIRSTINVNDNIRCVVLADGAAAPTAAEVNAGTGSGGAAAVQNPPAVAATAGNPADVAFTGLTGGTQYDAYCATATDGALSSKLDFYMSGFIAQPTLVSAQDSQLTLSFVSARSEDVRCVLLLDGEAAPTASEVQSGQGSSGGPVQANPGYVSASAGVSTNYLVLGLAADTEYDVYCVTVAGMLSNVADMATSGFKVDPVAKAGGYDVGQITVTFQSHNTENVRCVAMADNAGLPTGADINAGTAGHVGTSPAAASATGGSDTDVILTGLVNAVAYDVYCATASNVVSLKLDSFASGFAVQPIKGTDSAGISITVVLTPTVSENIRCVALSENAAAPTAAEVNAGQANGGGSPISSSMVTTGTAGSSLSVTLSGLIAASHLDVYCATAAGILSNRLDLYTSGFSSQPVKSGDVAGVTVTVNLTITLDERVRCVAVNGGDTAPTGAETYAGRASGGGNPISFGALVVATANTQLTYTVSTLFTPATDYDVYCATESLALSNRLDMYTSGFTVQPTAVSVTGSSASASFTASLNEDIRCVVISGGDDTLTAANVNAGTNAAGASPIFASSLQTVTALSTSAIAITGLSPGVDYDMYCATAAGTLSTRVDFFSSGFSSQPAQSSITGTSLILAMTLSRSENVNCIAVTDGSATPTGSEVYAGTASGGSSPAGASGPISATAATALTMTISSLPAAAQFDAYCSTAATQISTKLDIATSGYAIQPSVSAIQGTKLTVTLTSASAESSRCVAVADGAAVPLGDKIFAGQDAAAQSVPKTPITSCLGGGSATCTLGMTGLSVNTNNDVYCATSAGEVSNKIDVLTLADTDCDSIGGCSGHGECNENVCICEDGYGSVNDIAIFKSPKCDQRVCPSGRSWADVPSSPTEAHRLAECSDAGVCNRDNGQCECFEGYDGDACDHTACIKDCSGHGRCVSLREAAGLANAMPLRCYSTKYEGSEQSTTWDSDMIYGCVCDSSWTVGYGAGETQVPEYFGNSCQYKRCPSGNDPVSISDDTQCVGLSDNGKSFGVTLYATNIIVSSSGATATVTYTNTVNTNSNSVSERVHLKAGDVVIIEGMPSPSALNNAWTVTGIPTTTTFTFASSERGFTTDGTYTADTDGVTRTTAKTCQGASGNLCHVECSNRGICDYGSGTCTCSTGYTGAACEIVRAVL